MDINLKQLINDSFPKKEAQALIKVLSNGSINRKPKDKEYKALIRTYKKLKSFRKILEYEQIAKELKQHQSTPSK